MKTTSLFVEILMIGSGLITWLGLLAFAFLGLDWLPSNLSINSLILIPFTAILYVLGIVWDRVVDRITDFWDKPIRNKYFTNSNEYHIAKDTVYSDAEPLKDLFEYTRSRMRICRSWMIDWLMISITFPFYIYSNNLVTKKITFIIFFSTVFFLLSLITFYSWKKLTRTFYMRLTKSYALIKDKG